MAVIFNKLPASGEQCLILGSREALIYPFDFGNWTQMRIGCIFSATTVSDDNAEYGSESMVSNANSNGFYFGLTNNGHNLLPYSTGVYFIGMGSTTGVSSHPTTSLSASNLAQVGGLIRIFTTITGKQQTSVNDIPGTTNATVTPIQIPTAVNCSGTGAFSMYNGIRFILNDANGPTQNFTVYTSFDNGGGGSPNTSIDYLRSKLSSFPNESAAITGMRWNAICERSGTPLSVPNSVLLYAPYMSNRVRLHAIVVEKYE